MFIVHGINTSYIRNIHRNLVYIEIFACICYRN
nr:MAG TPA: hypothetical protein [Caudoviricetes sp.]DAH49611.1 MAG TPA: hypothetical protein [Caudoviricetes sp.]